MSVLALLIFQSIQSKIIIILYSPYIRKGLFLSNDVVLELYGIWKDHVFISLGK